MRSWYVQLVGDNYPHDELIPLLFNGVRGAGGHHDLVDALRLRDHLASQGIRRYAFPITVRARQFQSTVAVPCLPKQVLQAQPSPDLVDDKEGERIKPGNKNALEADLDNAAIKAPCCEDGNTMPRESRQRE